MTEATTTRPKSKRAARKLVPLTGEEMETCEWRNNADLIRDVMELYARPGMTVVDMTYGDGKFWTACNPHTIGVRFNAHDIDRDKGDGVDWADLPEGDESVDIAIMDPDYVSRGGRETSTIPDMVGAYGMDYADSTPAALWTSICEGIDEAHRVLKPGGLFMLKCMNYISSGTFQASIKWAFEHFDALGFKFEDWAILVGGTGPQPLDDKCKQCIAGTMQTWVVDSYVDNLATHGHYEDQPCDACGGSGKTPRRQVHLRQNASHLLIVRKPRGRPA